VAESEMTIAQFRRTVWAHYKKYGRHDLPWRPPTLKLRRDKTLDPYRVLVSEIMLQQTQVERVIPFYKNFIKQFPTAKSLAGASLSQVLTAWQGLGYNRRAKMLHQAAKEFARRKTRTVAEWEALPGVGPYTARAVAAFARNEDVVFVETNIRTVVIQHFFPKKKKVSDVQIQKVLVLALPKGKAREWYSALMDYGAYLKRSGISHNTKSRAYAKQSKFTGSLREARGAILRRLAVGSVSSTYVVGLLGTSRRPQMRAALRALLAERLVKKKGANYALAD
jgi:A/G-specific adenine glycosylase